MAVSVTYREIAEHFGIGVEGARLKAKRRAAKGLWRIIPGNHPHDVVRVEVPEEEWAASNVGSPTRPNVGHPTPDPTTSPTLGPQQGLEALVELVSQLHAQAALLTSRLVDTERARAEAEKEAAKAAVLRETVESLKSALETERELRAELRRDRDRARLPWWRRLAFAG